MGKFLKKLIKGIKSIPVKLNICYKKWILGGSKKDTARKCKELQKYSVDVLGRGINKYNFEETKYMFLEYAEHRIACEKIIGIMAEALFAFALAVIYAFFPEKDVLQYIITDSVLFVAFFFLIFYIPKKIKEWFYDRNRNTKGIDKLTFDVYKIYINK